MMESKPFHETVSVFKNFSASPVGIPLLQWLAACKKGGKYTDQVLRYRDTGAPEIKKSLPLVTPGARCQGGRRKENIVSLTGWICLDIDGKDNPHLTDAAKVRDEIFKISNIAFAALSTGGKGVWALVKVSDPEDQEAHFNALLKDFEGFGITLDSSKGRNPHDARFYSFDPEARIKHNFEIYTKKHSPAVPSRAPAQTQTGRTKYGEKALQQEIGALAMAGEGTRNETLFKSATALFELAAGGELEMAETEGLLHDTALRIGLSEGEIQKTLASAKKTGLSNPRTATNPQRPPSKASAPPRKKNAEPKRDYPSDWDKVSIPKEGSAQALEAEYYAAMDADPMLWEIQKTFDAVLTHE